VWFPEDQIEICFITVNFQNLNQVFNIPACKINYFSNEVLLASKFFLPSFSRFDFSLTVNGFFFFLFPLEKLFCTQKKQQKLQQKNVSYVVNRWFHNYLLLNIQKYFVHLHKKSCIAHFSM